MAALSAMVVQAGAARRLVAADPAAAAGAFASVEHSGRDALTEIRSLLGVLRREDEELALAPQPSLAHVGSLVERVRASGLPVTLRVEGERPALSAGADLTAFRVLQEALGEALTPGGAGAAEVGSTSHRRRSSCGSPTTGRSPSARCSACASGWRSTAAS